MGYLRRVAAILRHQKAGFTDNGMVTWKVPEQVVDEAGRIAASYPQVSHCYRRPISSAFSRERACTIEKKLYCQSGYTGRR